MRKYWFRIVVSLWLAVLTVGMIVLYNRMEIIPEVLSEPGPAGGNPAETVRDIGGQYCSYTFFDGESETG